MRQLLLALALLVMPVCGYAQSFEQLWKDVKSASNKDLPKTEIAALDKIVAKAQKENNYGQLLAAGLQRGSCQLRISPDSLKSEVGRMEQSAEIAKSPALKAVWYAILADIYASNRFLGDDHAARGNEYRQKALANPSTLAATNAKDYEPIVGSGADSKIFNNDLLHVIGFKTNAFDVLNKYYDANGNRAAACLSALNAYAYGTDKDALIQKLDSIINVYGDLDVCAEVAKARYDAMPGDGNANAKAKYEYGEKIIERWKSWQNINSVRNSQKQLTQPMLKYSIDRNLSIPNKVQKAHLTVRNITEARLTLTRLDMTGETRPSMYNDKEKSQVLAKRIKSTARTIVKNIVAEHAYDIVKDSIDIPALPVGVWLMEWAFASNGKQQDNPDYEIYNVSDVALISESLPEGKARLVVVNATTGRPIKGAHVSITQSTYNKPKNVVSNLTTDKNGETQFSFPARGSVNAWAYTDDDKAAPSMSLWKNGYNDAKDKKSHLCIMTDRSIYRPGQNVHVGIIGYEQDNAAHTRKALTGNNVTIVLRDANYNDVDKKTVSTDDFGTASADFALPSSGLTGRFTVYASTSGCSSSANINVEEYKRPTFEVAFDEYNEAYKAGDTVIINGHAKTYAGVPVQNAKVEYTVTRQNAWWCWWSDNDEDYRYTGTAVTDGNGNFKATMPVVLPSDDIALMAKGRRTYHYYNMCLSAKVTDQGGESHEGVMRLPIGTSPTALSCNMPEKLLADSLPSVTFRRVNVAGKEIDGEVEWTVVSSGSSAAEQWRMARANVPVGLWKAGEMKSGAYTLKVVCGEDTLTQHFIVFSITDKKPVVITHDWFWQSDDQFPRDGKPVYIQFGTSDADQHIIYTLIAGNKVIEQGVLDKSDAITTQAFKYKEEYGDGLVFSVAWVRNGNTYTHRAAIKRPEKDNRLMLKWKTFRNQLTPGQKEEWTLTVTTPDGKPANAQLMATLYDKSLDQISKHNWSFNPQYAYSLADATWRPLPFRSINGGSYANIAWAKSKELSFRAINTDYYEEFLYINPMNFKYRRSRGPMLMASAVPLQAAKVKEDMAFNTVDGIEVTKDEVAASESADTDGVEGDGGKGEDSGYAKVRENLNESAFFYPLLATDKDGNVALKFTLPESVTTWRFMGLAHDADINYGLITDEVVAKKTVMVQPNMPRFVRKGDKAQVVTRIFNTSSKTVHGKVRLEIIDPTTEDVISTEETTFDADSASTTSCAFDIVPSEFLHANDGQSLFIARVIADGNGFSDGEQHYLPVLSNLEYVTNTYPFTQTGKGTKEIDVENVLPKNVDKAKVTFEYTNNPTWLMVQALPYMSSPDGKNAISLVTAYFANSIAKQILNSDKKIKAVFEQWRRESGTETSLMSSLEKDQELKSLVLNETPWVADAKTEAEQKRSLANYFDENTIAHQLSNICSQLESLQNADGSFSWWQGMDGSFYMTVAVVKTLTRLQTMVAKPGNNSQQESQQWTAMIDNAWTFLDKEAARQVAEMKRLEAKKIKVMPSDALCDYVYSNALAKRKQTADINYIVNLLAKMPRDLTIYGKANGAVILAMYGHDKVAKEYLQSVDEYSVYQEEMGRYFDTSKAQYSWFDYKIPTQTAAIEAYRILKPSDTKTITDMQRWLLQEKRTQIWDTPLNSVNAIYAFLGGDTATSQLSELTQRTPVELSIDGKGIALLHSNAGTGYVKADISNEIKGQGTASSSKHSALSVVKQSDGVSWGAVYAQFVQPVTEIKTTAQGLTVKREVLDSNGGKLGTSKRTLKVGDKVRVRITITANRDYDFVQVVDKRAACLEPVSQLSGYNWGYYIAPHDYTTNYYFDRMAKGSHVVETEYYIDRAGEYQSGTCTAQCAYAPEFMGRDSAGFMVITK